MSDTEAIIFGRVLVTDESGTTRQAPNILFLTPRGFRPEAGAALTHPDNWIALAVCDSNGNFMTTAPLGTYGLMVLHVLHQPSVRDPTLESLRILPAVGVELAAAQSITYIGTLKIDIRQLPANQASSSERYVISETVISEDFDLSYAWFTSKFPKDKSLTTVTRLIEHMSSSRPMIDVSVHQFEYGFPWEMLIPSALPLPVFSVH